MDARFDCERAGPRRAAEEPRLRLGPVLGVLFAIQYAYFLTRNYYWDGVSLAIDIEKACTFRDLFKVHHLLSNFIGCGEYLLFSRGVRSLYLMQWTNCIAGGVLIWLTYRLLRSLEVHWMNSAACAAIIGLAGTFWKFTTDADSYILANGVRSKYSNMLKPWVIGPTRFEGPWQDVTRQFWTRVT